MNDERNSHTQKKMELHLHITPVSVLLSVLPLSYISQTFILTGFSLNNYIIASISSETSHISYATALRSPQKELTSKYCPSAATHFCQHFYSSKHL
jgi:hypothetical protein